MGIPMVPPRLGNPSDTSEALRLGAGSPTAFSLPSLPDAVFANAPSETPPEFPHQILNTEI